LPQYTHKIMLHGIETDNSFAFDSNIEVGNNALIVTGELAMYGTARRSWTKLVGNSYPGESFIFVETVDW